MRLTRWSHSCVALEHDGRRVVIDPGIWSEPAALERTDVVLVTHQHRDHVDVDRVAAAGARVLAPRGSELPGLDHEPLDPGPVDVPAFDVVATAGPHEPVVPGQVVPAHLGFTVTAGGVSVHHPGDGLTVPDHHVDVLLVAMQASWLRTSDAIDFIRAVAPERTIGIHDGQLHDRGRASINHWLSTAGPAYSWIPPGETVDLARTDRGPRASHLT